MQPKSLVAQTELSDLLHVEVTSVLNEKVPDGTRIGVVVRMKNEGEAVVLVPEYEVRLKTAEGVEYALQPSTANVKSIQPKAKTELSYMTTVDRVDAIALNEVNWTDVDVYVYPKKETLKSIVSGGDRCSGRNDERLSKLGEQA